MSAIRVGVFLLRLLGVGATLCAALMGFYVLWPLFLPPNQRPPDLGSVQGFLLAILLVSATVAFAAFRLARFLESGSTVASAEGSSAPRSSPPDDPSAHRLLKQALASAVIIGFLWFCGSFWKSSKQLIRLNSEGNTKGMLGALRSALSIYYGDLEGEYPKDLSVLLGGTDAKGKFKQWLVSIPPAHPAPYHGVSSQVQVMTDDEYKAGKFTDAGGWAYVIGGSTNAWDGTVLVNCTHTDTRGSVWSSY